MGAFEIMPLLPALHEFWRSVGNTIRSFDEIQLAIFEKYSKRRSDLDLFCDVGSVPDLKHRSNRRWDGVGG